MNDALIADTATRIFRELGAPRLLRDDASRQRLRAALDDAGLTRTWIDESLGGAGASLADGFEVVRIAGEHAVSMPLAESLLGAWLLARAGIEAPMGYVSLAPVDARDRIALNGRAELSGAARAVPFASEVEHLAVLAERDEQSFIAIVRREDCHVIARKNSAGDARDVVEFRNARSGLARPTTTTVEDVLLMGAATRALQIAGALQSILNLSVAYANTRIAFEKPIGKFQVIQHNLARLAGETAAAIAAAGSAADAIATSDESNAVFLEVASAKIRCGEAAALAAAIAHQVHGAIGFSQEHMLHRYTQRALAWRDDFGGESLWAARLGSRVAQAGADVLWPLLASR